MVRVHLNDEIPRLGSGVRFVTVAKLGRKWVTLERAGKRVRVKRELWNSIKRIEA